MDQIFGRDRFENPVKFIPPRAQSVAVRAWDFAGTEESAGSDPDFTVGLLMCRDPDTGVFYIAEVIRGRWSPGQVERAVKQAALIDGTEIRIRLPKDPGSAGKFQAYNLVTQLQGYSVWTEAEVGSKENRADAFAAQCEHGNVKLLEGSWNERFVEELCAFPNGAHDDQVDAAAAGFRTLLMRRGISAVGA